MKLRNLIKTLSLKTNIAVLTPTGSNEFIVEKIPYAFLKEWSNYLVEDIELVGNRLDIKLEIRHG